MAHPIAELRRDAGDKNPAVIELDARARARAARAQLVGGHLMTTLVVGELRDHGLYLMPRGTAHVILWIRDPGPDDLAEAELAIEVPDGVVMTLEVRHARPWHIVIGWARVALDLVARRWWAWRSAGNK
jgi:hypothetical protein